MTFPSEMPQYPEWAQYDDRTKKSLILLKLLEKKIPTSQSIAQEIRRLWQEVNRVHHQHDVHTPISFQPFIVKNNLRFFHPNALVQWVIDQTMYRYAPFLPGFSVEDQAQLAQLLGMSESVFLGLPFCHKALENRVKNNPVVSYPVHPSPPIVLNRQGHLCFKENSLLVYLVQSCENFENRPSFSKEDEEQVTQLLGARIGI